ncbi:MAG TPA: methionyl-tRNA formyltransferase, partial [Polyangiaceae bacterium]|nr:methionyl-tRNA formyltransferase [Polyangiaceae bacterium]
ERATYAPMLKKEDGRVSWSEPAQVVHNLVRGMHPWPGAFTTLDGATLKLHRTSLAPLSPDEAAPEPGTVLRADRDGVLVACGRGAVLIKRLQLAGKRRLDAEAFLAGHPLAAGTRLGAP